MGEPATDAVITVDRTRWPLLVMRWPAGRRDDEEILDAWHALREVELDRPHVFLVDARKMSLPTPPQIRILIDLQAELSPESECLATGLVTTSSALRALLDSLRWMKLSRQSFQSFDTVEAAEAHLRDVLPFD